MAISVAAPDADLLRRLAEIRLERPLVLSLYLDLNPSEFATPPARATAVRSLVDEADRQVRDQRDLPHDERVELKGTLEDVEQLLSGDYDELPSPGVAVFASRAEGLLETVRLVRSVPNRAAVDRSPVIGPLADGLQRERWCVVLINRQDARVFRGSPEGLREVEKVRDDVRGQHDQGGWSQARYQRSVEKEVSDHLKGTAERLLRHWKREPFERLVLGGPREVVAEFEGMLHGYLTELVAGHVEADVETATPDEVLERSRDCFETLDEQREREALERLNAGKRAVAGLEEVTLPLYERRVETLLLAEGFSAPGAICPSCGWLGAEGERSCPVDGTATEHRDDMSEHAIELAIQQAAAVLRMRRLSDQLDERGGIAALLRF